MHNYIEGRNHMLIPATTTEVLFKFGELSSLNSIGKYIFESFKSRDKQS